MIVLVIYCLWVLIGCQSAETIPTNLTFSDVAIESGLEFQHGAFRWGMSGDPVAMMGGGLCWLDYDGDGWQDLYVVNSYAEREAGRWQSEEGGLPTSVLYRNMQGAFAAVDAGVNVAMRGNGCVSADFNADSHPDLYVTTARVNLLFWNNGDGTFSEGGTAAGVDAYGWQTAANVGDLNGDGWLDLFVAGYVNINRPLESSTLGFPNTHEGMPDLVYLNNGDGTFQEVGEQVGLQQLEYGLGAVLSDFDGDSDLDLFVANDTNPNRLYTNESADNALGFRFVEVVDSPAVGDTNSGMGVASADYDNSGGSDLFITNMGRQFHSVYRNESQVAVAMSNAGSRFGVPEFGVGWTGWGTNWGDFDLDGDLDLFVAHGKIPVSNIANDGEFAQLYENRTAQGQIGRFVNASSTSQLDYLGPYLARGSAVADYDNDGDLDIALATIGGELALLRNDGAMGNWLTVAIADAPPGTVVTAILPDGTQLRREILVGGSYLSADDLRCHFGVGDVKRITELHIRYPDGREMSKKGVAVNRILHLP